MLHTTQVKIPHVDWQRVFDERPDTFSYYSLGRGYMKYFMSDGLQAYVVEDERYAADAVSKLRQSMQVQLAPPAMPGFMSQHRVLAALCCSPPRIPPQLLLGVKVHLRLGL